MEKEIWYSPNVAIKTDNVDENGNSTDVAGFFWYIDVQVDFKNDSRVEVQVRYNLNNESEANVIRTRIVKFNYEAGYQWTDEDCLNAVLAESIFVDSRRVVKDDPNTESDESGGLWSKVTSFFKSWFK